MLNKHNLAIASLASKDQSRFTLNFIKPHTSAVVCEPSPAPVKRSNNVANVGQRIWEQRQAKIAATKPAKLTAAEMLATMA